MQAMTGKWGWLVMLVLIVAACSRAPDQDRLRERINQMQADVQARRVDAVVQVLADDFTGNSGMDRRAVERMLRLQLLRNQRIDVVLGPLDVDVDGAHARVRFTVAMAGGQGGYLPDSGRITRVSTHWRHDAGDWQLYRASWGDGEQP